MKAAALIFLLSMNAIAGEGSDHVENFVGHARKDGKELYIEKVQIIRNSSGVTSTKTEFVSPDGTLLAQVTSKASKNRYLPDVDFVDYRDGYAYSVRHIDATSLELREKESTTQPWKTRPPFPVKPNMILIQSVSDFALDNLSDIRGGKKIKASFLVPSKGTDFGMQIALNETPRSPAATSVELKMESSNWVFRHTVFPKFLLTYDVEKKKVIKFIGVSTIMAELGTIEITYD